MCCAGLRRGTDYDPAVLHARGFQLWPVEVSPVTRQHDLDTADVLGSRSSRRNAVSPSRRTGSKPRSFSRFCWCNMKMSSGRSGRRTGFSGASPGSATCSDTDSRADRCSDRVRPDGACPLALRHAAARSSSLCSLTSGLSMFAPTNSRIASSILGHHDKPSSIAPSRPASSSGSASFGSSHQSARYPILVHP